ncbi:pre-16S rRNA-processing nuclease YqgF [Arthrospira platensis]|uniref:pre-16S rRNA-processing nuclease YqgF n=1 Tax=Limnospira TaxID=2596745 RepID=UPI000291F70B|nr:pre-16S rRNA-processing nuclease YqgF [Arthrospira platensis]AMW27557.1 resolvase [Arthrospira platensis YZ]KDR58759.1 resolvase [Arthrospira platensis str. Paraca]MBD2574819.1 pre-16S rRNA-processing nuclease YqgF [Arthrospira platensis FACHB-971]MBD2671111.1 pre-16S rRNA-processing nuclease YqgF [Arthrospira platensis FACHB-439]MBD2711946.1 pre-16S rRNA-processing nuclease YqgF [Arthrospira platensis FACHB-835]MDF2210023.1 pre-16S rRNA-processing nuclease YqgF [Arthrospira platensis NCB0
MILGFDPGRDKCGVAVVGDNQQVYYHQVVAANDAIATVESLCSQFSVQLVVMGNQTTSRTWKQQMRAVLPESIQIVEVDERYSSLQARDRYWEMYPPQGLSRLLPQGMRVPPRPIDDIVAIILVERYQGGN